MTFAFEFLVNDKHNLEKMLDYYNPPVSVRGFILKAVEDLNLHETVQSFTGHHGYYVLHIKAEGHLMDSEGSYEISNCTMLIKRMFVHKAKEK